MSRDGFSSIDYLVHSLDWKHTVVVLRESAEIGRLRFQFRTERPTALSNPCRGKPNRISLAGERTRQCAPSAQQVLVISTEKQHMFESVTFVFVYTLFLEQPSSNAGQLPTQVKQIGRVYRKKKLPELESPSSLPPASGWLAIVRSRLVFALAACRWMLVTG